QFPRKEGSLVANHVLYPRVWLFSRPPILKSFPKPGIILSNITCGIGMSAPPCATIKRWEEAGASLVAAVQDYLDLCVNLGTNTVRDGAEPKDLVSRIDSTLDAVHTRISRCIGESTSALARTRNKVASLVHKFPEEVLSEIFLNVIFDRNSSKGVELLSMKHGVWLVYRRLYNLMGVCSTWRDIAMARGAFWSIIPMVPSASPKSKVPFELSLQRAGGSALHLAADNSSTSSLGNLTAVLSRYGLRFRTAIITMDDEKAIRLAISELLKYTHHGSLSELSIQFTQSLGVLDDLPEDFDYVFPRGSPEQASFSSMMQSLTAFRTYGTLFHWDTIAFSARLTEFRIEQVALGYDDAIIPVVRALSSASSLRDLKIISVTTFRNARQDRDSLLPVTFPNLESLLLQDLYLNTLEYLLPMLAPGSYSLALFLSQNSIEISVSDDESIDESEVEFFDFVGLCRVLGHTSVDTLMLSGHQGSAWVRGAKLRRLLGSMPTLKTLKIENWEFGPELSEWKYLRPGQNTQASSNDDSFPALENLHLSSIRIRGSKGFHKVVTSHPLQRVTLGGTILVVRQDGTNRWRALKEGCPLVKWLRGKVPDVRLVEADYRPPEFCSNLWKSW
ncbi:unnamed protein product, partial [Rhizoctonia solani]